MKTWPLVRAASCMGPSCPPTVSRRARSERTLECPSRSPTVFAESGIFDLHREERKCAKVSKAFFAFLPPSRFKSSQFASSTAILPMPCEKPRRGLRSEPGHSCPGEMDCCQRIRRSARDIIAGAECTSVKIILFANTDWFLYNFRLRLAIALRQRGAEVVLLSPPGDYGPDWKRRDSAGFRSGWRAADESPAELWTILRLVRLYRRERPELVHHFTIKCVLYGSLAGRWTRVRPWSTPLPAWATFSAKAAGDEFVGQAPAARAGKILVPAGLARHPGHLREPGQSGRICGPGPGPGGSGQPGARRRHRRGGLPPGRRAGRRVVVMLAARMLWDKGVGEFVEAARLLRAEVRRPPSSWWVTRIRITGGHPAEQLKKWQQRAPWPGGAGMTTCRR